MWYRFLAHLANRGGMPSDSLEVRDELDTVEALIEYSASLVRYGNFQFRIMYGENAPDQPYSAGLARRLRRILRQSRPDSRLMVALPRPGARPEDWKGSDAEWELLNRRAVLAARAGRVYFSSFVICPHTLPPHTSIARYYRRLRQAWDGRPVTIVAISREDSRHEIYANAKYVNFVAVPEMDAYSAYSRIRSEAMDCSTANSVIILCAGTVSPVLGADLHRAGYRAIDVGRLGDCYDRRVGPSAEAREFGRSAVILRGVPRRA
jgi:hypothetical protein